MSERLVSLLYEETGKEESKEIKEHLKSCNACKKAFEEIRGTSELLNKWPDETPSMNLVFVHEPSSRWETFKEQFFDMSWARRAAILVPGIAILVFLILSIMRVQIQYDQNGFQMAFGGKNVNQGVNEQLVIDTMKKMQDETLTLTAQMIRDSEEKQRRENTLTFAQFARDFESQRQQDLRVVGRGLEGLRLINEGRFSQTQNTLNDLMKMTSLNVERK
jgi:hypothetical protein